MDISKTMVAPMRVAWYCVVGEQPELHAWTTITAWAKQAGLLDNDFPCRFFGFNNPNPTDENPVYGYEVWVTVPPDIAEHDEIKLKDIAGGWYAATRTTLAQVMETWMNHQAWQTWLETNHVRYDGSRHLLEEVLISKREIDTLISAAVDMDTIQLDLYLPIQASEVK
ncbi:GyrI-like domain-containing protein [candidate division KSB1 bacterium]|nr:GyrI-like domain-containing protein [candidate division KSB1 bacterium]